MREFKEGDAVLHRRYKKLGVAIVEENQSESVSRRIYIKWPDYESWLCEIAHLRKLSPLEALAYQA